MNPVLLGKFLTTLIVSIIVSSATSSAEPVVDAVPADPVGEVRDVDDEGCTQRTNKVSYKGAITHDPVSKGECLKCHSSHNTDYPNLLNAVVPDLCMDCHAEGIGDSPPLAIYKDKLMNQHKPFEEGKCLCCHESHVGDHIKLLSQDYPQTLYATYSDEQFICLDCHQKEAFDQPRTLTETAFRNGNLNLHYRHVNRKKGRTCRVCHHHHGSNYPALIRDENPFGSNKITISLFEKTETGGTCASTCHIKAQYDRYEPVFNALKVTPRLGVDATVIELFKLKQEQMDAIKHDENLEKTD